MSVKTISLEDLMTECHIESSADFRRVLRKRGIRVLPRDKPVERELANNIVLQLTGNSIDWDKYERMERDRTYEGPLSKRPFARLEDHGRVEQWYQKLCANQPKSIPKVDQILGVVFTGGFLGKTDGAEFVLKLEPGVNVLIGHRGSGKSTVLNLAGLIADSISEETNVLIDKLVTLLKTDSEEVDVARRVRRTLKQYGVDRYACYFAKDGELLCYFVNIHEAAYDILKRGEGGDWQPLPGTIEGVRPRMQVLQQGEVIRISEEKERYYLNNLLDTLYPDLYEKRESLTQLIKKVAKQSESYRSNNVQLSTARVERFIEQRSEELRGIVKDIRHGNLSNDSIQLIAGYLKRISQVNRHALPSTIAQLLKEEEDAFYQLYLGRIVPIFAELAGQLERLQERQSALAEEAYSKLDEAAVSDSILINSEVMEEIDEDKQVLAEMELAGFTDGSIPAVSSLEASLFMEALKAESNNPIYRKMLSIGRRIVDLLYTRLRILRTWARIFSRQRPEWNPSLAALINSCVQLLQQRIELISLQEKKCQLVSKVLHDDELEINIFTRGVDDSVAEHRADIQGLNRLASLYERLFSATPSVRLRQLRSTAIDCDEYLERFKAVRQIVKEVIESNRQHEFLFINVEVDLRQGGVYRNFGQLSFGQKSGIILKLVLLTSKEGVIVIDQPEDNLDANSINMLSPTLNYLGKKRQVIIATHNSNLVLTLDTKNLVVMESQGDTGRIKASGSPLSSKNIVSEMLDILEGGVHTFALKMDTYERFTSRVRGEIQDMDLQLIESSFRRRTIDNLRNLLQPVVSSKSMIAIARHQLNQRDRDALQKDVSNLRGLLSGLDGDGQVDLPALTVRLDTLLARLSSYIERLNIAINDIRMMDTRAQPRDLELYALLSELRKDYLERIDKHRRIRIDLDERLRGQLINADEDHLRLVFRNLMNNSFRATEQRVFNNFRRGQSQTEAISIKLMEDANNRLSLLFMDNGCGIRSDIKRSLYVERCSDQKVGEHGLGGIIIRKLLNLNGGAIQILDDYPAEDGFVTVQQIMLPGVKPKNQDHT